VDLAPLRNHPVPLPHMEAQWEAEP
jgi:hypothetical protein